MFEVIIYDQFKYAQSASSIHVLRLTNLTSVSSNIWQATNCSPPINSVLLLLPMHEGKAMVGRMSLSVGLDVGQGGLFSCTALPLQLVYALL